MKKLFKMLSPFNVQEEIPTAFFIIKKLLHFFGFFDRKYLGGRANNHNSLRDGI